MKGSIPTCEPCHENCASCLEPALSNSCTSCITDLYLQLNLIPQECVLCDQENEVKFNNGCFSCHATCKTCDEHSKDDSCLTCPDDHGLDGAVSKGKCIDCAIPKKILENGKCLDCHTNCRKCNAPTLADKCTECETGYYFKEGSNPGECVLCDQRSEKKVGNDCLRCHGSCKTCDQINDVSSCTACMDHSQKLEGATGPAKCVTCDVNNGFVVVGDRCEQCHSTCKIP